MSERDFVYWLQGYLEISGSENLTSEQVKIIRDHLNLVLTKVTPQYSIVPAFSPCFGKDNGCKCTSCNGFDFTVIC